MKARGCAPIREPATLPLNVEVAHWFWKPEVSDFHPTSGKNLFNIGQLPSHVVFSRRGENLSDSNALRQRPRV